MKRWLVILLLFTVAVSAQTTTNYWLGITNNAAAGDSSNWSRGALPGPSDLVVFSAPPTGSNSACIWNTNVTIHSIWLQSGFTSTVKVDTATLQISNNVIVEAGTLDLTNRTVTLIPYNTPLTITVSNQAQIIATVSGGNFFYKNGGGTTKANTTLTNTISTLGTMTAGILHGGYGGNAGATNLFLISSNGGTNNIGWIYFGGGGPPCHLVMSNTCLKTNSRRGDGALGLGGDTAGRNRLTMKSAILISHANSCDLDMALGMANDSTISIAVSVYSASHYFNNVTASNVTFTMEAGNGTYPRIGSTWVDSVVTLNAANGATVGLQNGAAPVLTRTPLKLGTISGSGTILLGYAIASDMIVNGASVTFGTLGYSLTTGVFTNSGRLIGSNSTLNISDSFVQSGGVFSQMTSVVRLWNAASNLTNYNDLVATSGTVTLTNAPIRANSLTSIGGNLNCAGGTLTLTTGQPFYGQIRDGWIARPSNGQPVTAESADRVGGSININATGDSTE